MAKESKTRVLDNTRAKHDVRLVVDEEQVVRIERIGNQKFHPMWKIAFDDAGTLHITCTDIEREMVLLPCTSNKIELQARPLKG